LAYTEEASRRVALSRERLRRAPERRWLVHAGRWRPEEGFDGCPRGTVGQRPKPQRPVVAKLLPNGCCEVRGLKVLSLCFGSLEACPPVVGGIYPVAATLDRPD
jgi:hypothetical protein